MMHDLVRYVLWKLFVLCILLYCTGTCVCGSNFSAIFVVTWFFFGTDVSLSIYIVFGIQFSLKSKNLVLKSMAIHSSYVRDDSFLYCDKFFFSSGTEISGRRST